MIYSTFFLETDILQSLFENLSCIIIIIIIIIIEIISVA